MVLDTLNTAAGALLALLAEPVPNPPADSPPGLDTVANMFLGWLKWIGIVGGVGGLMVCALMMMIGRRNRSSLAADGASGIPWVFAGLCLISLASGLVAVVLV